MFKLVVIIYLAFIVVNIGNVFSQRSHNKLRRSDGSMPNLKQRITGLEIQQRDLDYNPCLPNPCQNDAFCESKKYDYNCKCKQGYKGKNCEKAIDQCFPNPCKHEAVCWNKVNDYDCICNPGYRGRNCEIVNNKCLPNPCQNEAFCESNVNDYNCICKQGYKGKNCEKAIDQCFPNPCKHEAVCWNKVNDYDCICEPGYQGRNCEIDSFAMAVSVVAFWISMNVLLVNY